MTFTPKTIVITQFSKNNPASWGLTYSKDEESKDRLTTYLC